MMPGRQPLVAPGGCRCALGPPRRSARSATPEPPRPHGDGDAAHIHPFSEAADDDPRNGLALTPDMHWAMDRNLIAPDADFVWRVSRALDDRVPDYQRLTGLDGRKLFLPGEKRLWPKRESLAWRIERLNMGYRRAL